MTITVEDLTSGTLTGTGVFDSMMRAIKVHLHEEFSTQRIKGAEYATVYLGAMSSVMDRSLELLLQKERIGLEADLLREQILKMQKETLLVAAQIAQAEAATELTGAQLALAQQQKLNLEAEGLLIPKQGLKLDAEVAIMEVQKDNEVLQGDILVSQKCNLDADFDLKILTKDKIGAETSLLIQRKVTEQAQVVGGIADEDSVVGQQIKLYTNQANGYLRDAEQKVANLLADTFNVRATTDGAVQGSAANRLDDATIARAMDKLLAGINA